MAIGPPASHSRRRVGPGGQLRSLRARIFLSRLRHRRSKNNRDEQERSGAFLSSPWRRLAHEPCATGASRLRRRTLYLLHVPQNTSNPMPGETLYAPAPLRSVGPVTRTLPRHLLYSIFARIGGSGLDTDAFETLRASYRG